MIVVLVADTSVLVDLERGALLDATFASGLVFAVPDALYQKELAADIGPGLLRLGLRVVTLGPDEVSLAQQVFNQRRASLSLEDCFALACAARESHQLLTGDKALTAAARDRGIPVHGLLWLLDELANQGAAPPSLLHAGLEKIAAHRRARLPSAEVQARLRRWGNPLDPAAAPE